LRELSDKITALQSALAAAERVFTLYDTQAFLPAGTRNTLPEKVDICFENVSFGYSEGKPVLSEVSFRVNPGESVAIVGATGSGKSTTIALCNKFYLPSSGRVLLGGHPIEEYTEESISKQVSLISQDVYLFSESIAFNIALSPDFSLERVEEVCRYVNAHGFIMRLPEGYQSKLKERGENLSTGQRQLLAFARALYHQPKILLLDEATSSVDTETESLVQEALDKIMQNMTSIVVAHRLSTIQKATKILVMHKGRIREAGTHQQLLKQDGIYRKLYDLQRVDSQPGKMSNIV
jgi:ATP-binding cassette subfamily B protein